MRFAVPSRDNFSMEDGSYLSIAHLPTCRAQRHRFALPAVGSSNIF